MNYHLWVKGHICPEMCMVHHIYLGSIFKSNFTQERKEYSIRPTPLKNSRYTVK